MCLKQFKTSGQSSKNAPRRWNVENAVFDVESAVSDVENDVFDIEDVVFDARYYSYSRPSSSSSSERESASFAAFNDGWIQVFYIGDGQRRLLTTTPSKQSIGRKNDTNNTTKRRLFRCWRVLCLCLCLCLCLLLPKETQSKTENGERRGRFQSSSLRKEWRWWWWWWWWCGSLFVQRQRESV